VSIPDEQRDFVQQLVERYRNSLERHVAGLLGSRTDAEDIVQETAARLLAIQNLEPHEARARSYMFRVATNLAWDRHRQRRESSVEDLDPARQTVLCADTPDAIVDLDRAIDEITRTLLALKPRCRRVFLLRAAEGLEYEAIAERLGVSKRTVEREMKHALDACQRRLSRRME
jgi:RNA polymerase sigma factor (sigma-70 family)